MLRDQQIAWNRESVDGWDLFGDHRSQITRLLSELAPSRDAKLAVLGAGNCNDIDLPTLCQSYAAIELLDWDRTAVVEGVRRQGCCTSPQVSIDAPHDLCESPATVASYDCVASLGLLSQLMLAVTSPRQPSPQQLSPQQTIAAASALRWQHFEHLLARLTPGGRGLLSFEFVSSDTLLELNDCAWQAVPTIAAAAVNAGNFYTGLHPAAIYHTALDLVNAKKMQDLNMVVPWKWNFGPRVYAVAALRFGRPLQKALY